MVHKLQILFYVNFKHQLRAFIQIKPGLIVIRLLLFLVSQKALGTFNFHEKADAVQHF